MKWIFVLLTSAAALSAQTADFTTGQAARLVIGQRNFTAQDPNSSDVVIGAVSGLAFAGDTLFVADSNRVGASPNNHRVLLYKGASSMFPNPSAALALNSRCPACVGQATVVLGQPNFTTITENLASSASALRLPTAVASDGVRLVVADTNHNRLLIWNRIPTINNQPADVVLGQPDFNTSNLPPATPTAKTLRGPQGVWIQNGRLFVADTQNNRVVIYNRIPTSNDTAADVVLGAPNFTTFVEPDLTQQKVTASSTTMLNPVSVTSDGTRLFVTDLGFNRVLVWNSIPTSNTAPADFALGQPDLTSAVANNAYTVDSDTGIQTAVLCTESNGEDDDGNPTYPGSCNRTLNFPRFALSDGERLFVADGGNDRVLIYKKLPTENGAAADSIIGQVGGDVNQASDAADSLRGPLSLAWDGVNLYVSDAFNRRITVYSVGRNTIPYQGVRNAASFAIFATGSIAFGGSIQTDDELTVTIGDNEYTYKVKSADTLEEVVQAVTDAINNSNDGAGDPKLFATANLSNLVILLKAKDAGPDGNDISYSVAVTPTSKALLQVVAGGATLSGGADAAKVAAGTIVSVIGTGLSAGSASADLSQNQLPRQLAGTRVYFNGVEAPLLFVSPTQINAQIPWEALDTTSLSAYVRSEMDGGVMTTTPVAVSIVPANPGIFTTGEQELAVMYHGSSQATAIVSIDGTVTKGDIATVNIESRAYSYTAVEGDTLDIVRDALVALINQDPKVTAEASGMFDRILLRARVEGPEGNGIPISGSVNAGGTVIVTAFAPTLCCANVEGSAVTDENPAIPGEVLIIYATGLGLQKVKDENRDLVQTGVKYPEGGPVTEPTEFVSSIAGGKTADVFTATFLPGAVGMYKVIIHLNSDLATDPLTSLTIAQNEFVSNVAKFPVVRGQ